MDELVVVWNGSFRDTYLCIPPYVELDLSHVEPLTGVQSDRYQSRDPQRDALLVLLAQKPVWLTSELRRTAQLEKSAFWSLLTSLRVRGLITRSPGLVAVKTRSQG